MMITVFTENEASNDEEKILIEQMQKDLTECLDELEAKGLIIETDSKENKMLILTRRVGESIIIGDDIAIIVLGVNGRQAKIGIEAPKDTSVHREEIYKKIQEEKYEKTDKITG